MYKTGELVDIVSDRSHAGLPNRKAGEVWDAREEPNGMTVLQLTVDGPIFGRLPAGNYYCIRWSGTEWDWFAEDELAPA